MTPGELAIYEYMVDQNAHYAKINIQLAITNEVLHTVRLALSQKLTEIEQGVWEYIFSKLGAHVAGAVKKYSQYSLFTCVKNDICNAFQYMTCSQGHCDIYPLRGHGVTMTYEELYVQLGISKDVAKRCIDSLLQQGKIERKRGMGGYRYCAEPRAILDKCLEDPGEWRPVTFDPEKYSYVEDGELFDLITGVYGDTAAIQQDYLDRIQQRALTKLATGK